MRLKCEHEPVPVRRAVRPATRAVLQSGEVSADGAGCGLRSYLEFPPGSLARDCCGRGHDSAAYDDELAIR